MKSRGSPGGRKITAPQARRDRIRRMRGLFRARRTRDFVTRRVTPYPRTECAGNDSAPFSLRGKEKAAGGKKKTPKGDLRRNKLHIPHPAASGRSRPFRCSSFSRANRFTGFAREPLLWNPLKTTKKRADAPFLDHSQGLVCAKENFRLTKRDADANLDKPAW